MSGLTFGEVELRLREPAGDPAGALILNHGRGADEHDLYPLLDEIDPERRLLGLATGAPITGIPPGGRHWYVVERVGYPHAETFDASLGLLTATLDELLADRGIPWSQTTIGGFSQGTVMSYATALGFGRPAPGAVIALSGFVPTVAGWEADLERAAATRFYIHHGAADPVIGVEHARAARDLLRGAGIEPAYRETASGHALPAVILPELREFAAAGTAADRVSGG